MPEEDRAQAVTRRPVADGADVRGVQTRQGQAAAARGVDEEEVNMRLTNIVSSAFAELCYGTFITLPGIYQNALSDIHSLTFICVS